MRTAIWASPLHWQVSTRVSAHHYATFLAQEGWKVAFLSFPISPFHLLTSSYRKSSQARFRSWLQDGELDLHERLTFYTPFTLTPPCDALFLRGSWALKWWHHATIPRLQGWIKRHGFSHPDLLVIDSPAYAFLLDELRPRKSLLRIVDRTASFQGVTAAMSRREQTLISQVDHVVYTAHSLLDFIQKHRPKAATLVPAGADITFFRNHPAHLPPEYGAIPRPRAIYVGAIDHWFDVELLFNVASACAKVSFVIVGPARISLDRVSGLSNVFLLGSRPYTEIPAYLRNSDLGIIPFFRNDLVDAVCPIKLFEYMACGLPVVSTRWRELETMATPALLCSNETEFASAVKQTIEAPATSSARLMEYAESADWRLRFRQMADAIGISPQRPESMNCC